MSDASPRTLRLGAYPKSEATALDDHIPGAEGREVFRLFEPVEDQEPPLPKGYTLNATRQALQSSNSIYSQGVGETAIVIDGRWRFQWGHDGTDGEVVLERGDVFNIPTGLFRGFEAIGGDHGLLFFLRGGDRFEGDMTWTPDVLDAAFKAGYILGEDGVIYNKNAGEKLPRGTKRQKKLTKAELEDKAAPSAVKLVSRYVRRYWDLMAISAESPCKVLGAKGIIRDKPGFEINFLSRGSAKQEAASEAFVSTLVPVTGPWTVSWEGGEALLCPGDAMEVPADMAFSAGPALSGEAALYHIVGTGDPAGATWTG